MGIRRLWPLWTPKKEDAVFKASGLQDRVGDNVTRADGYIHPAALDAVVVDEVVGRYYVAKAPGLRGSWKPTSEGRLRRGRAQRTTPTAGQTRQRLWPTRSDRAAAKVMNSGCRTHHQISATPGARAFPISPASLRDAEEDTISRQGRIRGSR